jgi:hypothetical protein
MLVGYERRQLFLPNGTHFPGGLWRSERSQGNGREELGSLGDENGRHISRRVAFSEVRGTMLVFLAPNLEQQESIPVTIGSKAAFSHRAQLYHLLYGDVFIGSPEIKAAAVVAKKRTSTSLSF